MNAKLNFLLRTLLSVAVQDREAFVERFSKLWEDYTGGDAETGKQKGLHLAEGVETLRNELQWEATAKRMSESDKEEILSAIQQLEQRIEKLNRKIDNAGTKDSKKENGKNIGGYRA